MPRHLPLLTRAAAAAFAALLAATGLAQGQEYPARPIKLIVPFAPGGTTDALGRLVANSLGSKLGQSVVVENRPGAGSQIGVESAARSPSDGYTLLFGSADGLAIVPAMKKKAPYDPVKDFAPIAMVARAPLVFVVHSKFAPSTLSELIAFAKAKPGAVRYGSAGTGSILHLGVELLQSATGTEMVHVPYKGGGPMMTAVVSGEVEMVLTAPDFVKRFADTGQIKPLAQADTARHPLIPNVPTVADVGMPGILVVSWFGVLGPAGLPKAVVDRVGKALGAVIEEPLLKERMVQAGASPAYLQAADFGRHIAEESRRWDRVVKEARVPLQD